MPPGGANFQLIIETLLKSPNIRGFAGEFDATMRRIKQQAQAGQVSPASASKQLRESAASTEAALTLSSRAGLIGPKEERLLRQHFRRQYEQGAREMSRLLGEEVKVASQKQISTLARKQTGTAAQGGLITPTFDTDPANPRAKLNPAVTRIQRLLAEMALTDLDYIEERALLISALRRLRTAENAVAEALETQAIRGERASVRAEQARNRRAAALGIDERRVAGTRDSRGRLVGRTETNDEYEDRIARAAHRQEIERSTRRHRAKTQHDITADAQEAEARREYLDARRHEQRLLQRNNARNATFFQRVLNLAHDRPGRTVPASQEAGPAGFFASRLLTTASYGASAAILYSFVNTLREAGRYALELQRVTERLRAQFESLDQSGQFRGFRAALLGIARETGVVGDQVVFVGLQMKGAFGDTAVAIERTKESIRAAQVTGLPLTEVVDSLTAASISYGSSIDDITDKAIGLEQRFGVTAQQSIKSFGDISTVAEEAGLSLNEVAGILGVIQQRSGRSLSAITEGLSRVLPAIQEKAADILLFADSQAALQGQVPQIQEDIAAGRTGQVLLTLAEAWGTLDESAKKTVITLLGGRREAQYLIPLFEGSAEVLEEAARGAEDQGKAAEYQAAQQRTLGYQLARVREEFNQLADAFGRLGLLQGFALLAAGAVGALNVLGQFTRLLVELNDAAGGIPAKVLAIAFAVRTLSRAIAAARAIGVVVGELAAGQLAGRIGQNALAQRAAQGIVNARGVAATSLAAGAGNAALGLTGLPQLGRLVGAGAARLGVGGIATFAGGSALAATGVGLAAAAAAVGVAKLVGTLNDLNRSTKQATQASQDRLAALRAQVAAEKEQREEEEDKDKPDKPRRKPYEKLDYYGLTGRGFDESAGQLAKDFGGELAGKLPFVDYTSQAERYDAALQAATAQAFKGYLDTLRESGQGKRADELQGILDDVVSKSQSRRDLGGLKAREILDSLSKAQRDKVLEAVNEQQAAADAAADGAATVVATADELAEQYSRGQISWDKYITSLRRQIEVLGKTDATRPALLQLQKQERAALAQRFQQTQQFSQQFAELSGADPIDTRISLARQKLYSPTSGPLQRVEAIQDLMGAMRDRLQKDVEEADSYADAVNIAAAGAEVSPAIIAALRAALKKAGLPVAYINEIIRLNEEVAQQALVARGLAEALGAEKVALGADPTAAERAASQRREAAIRLWFAAQKPGGTTKTDRDEYASAVQEADQADADAAEQRAIAHLELQLASTEDPAAQARIRQAIAALKIRYANGDEIDAAKAEAVNAARQARDAQRAIVDARFSLAEAQAGQNDLLLAQIAQQRAAEAIERAKGAGEAAQLEAMAAKIRADHAMEQYLLDAAHARRDLAIAVAESLGDAAEVGRLTVEQAQEDLETIRRLRDQGQADDTDVIRAETAKVKAEADEKERARNERIGDLEYLFEFDRITAGQLIAGLTAELALIPESNKEARREIERRIKAIRDEMGKDMQFNIGAIKLPTFYEVQRLVGAGGPGGYQAGRINALSGGAGPMGVYDNRVVNITIAQINNGGDLDDAIGKITQAVGGPSRYGTRPRQFGTEGF